MTRRNPLLLLSMLLVAGSLRAGGVAHVTADVPSQVRYDGEFVGTTPLVLSQVPAGAHVVQLEEPTSGRIQVFRFRSTGSAAVEHRLAGRFTASGAVPPSIRPAPQVVYQSAPTQLVYAAPYVPRYTSAYYPTPRYYPSYRPRPSISFGFYSGRGRSSFGRGYRGHARGHSRGHGYGGWRGSHGGLSIGFWR